MACLCFNGGQLSHAGAVAIVTRNARGGVLEQAPALASSDGRGHAVLHCPPDIFDHARVVLDEVVLVRSLRDGDTGLACGCDKSKRTSFGWPSTPANG